MRKNGVQTYLHGDHLGGMALSTSSANATLGHRAYGPGAHRARFYTGSTPTRYQFTARPEPAEGASTSMTLVSTT